MRVLVTGASRGIGLGIVNSLAAAGHEVCAGYRRAASRPPTFPSKAVHAIELDVTNEQSIRNAYEATDDWPRLDVLINNAGLYDRDGGSYDPDRQRLGTLTQDKAVSLYALNAVGPLLVTQAWMPRLRCSTRPGGAVVINISSLIGSITAYKSCTSTGNFYYGPTKAALNWITVMLHEELYPHITVTAITPGWTRTRTGGSKANRTPDQVGHMFTRWICILNSQHSGRFFDVDGTPIPW